MDDLTIATQMDVHDKDDAQCKSILGMEFDSEQSAYEFYNSYGGRVGFSIRKEYAHKSKTGEITSRTFVCSKEGLRKSDKRDFAVRIPRAETRTGCGALMSIKLIRQIGKYRVINFVETHNHPLVVSACAHMLPSQRKISTSQYIEIDLVDDCGIPLRSSYELMGREAGGVRSVLGKFIDEYEEEEEFFAAWNAMLDKFDVHDNSWLQSIFHLRKKWVRAYVRWTWSAGIKSTQLSESLNADLKEYLRSDYNLIQFFTHFERVLNEKRYKEYEAEYALSYKLPRIKVQVLMLIQAGNVYTKTIFEEFQDEYVASLELYVANCVHKDDCLVYIVKAYRQSTMREVKKDKDGNLSCSCRLFEMKGILCSHVTKVLRDEMIIMEIPNQYILKRWTKLARAEIVQDYKGRDIQADPKLEQSSRYKSLCSLFTMISSQASELEETYEDCVQEGKKLLAFVQNKLRVRITNGPLKLHDGSSTMRTNEGSENVIQAKGLKKRIDPIRGRRRIKSSLEKALETSRKKKQRVQDVHMSSNMRQPLAEVPNSMPWTWNGEPQYANFRALLQGSTLLNSSQCSTSTHYNQVPNLNIIRNSPTPIYPEILGD